jgi:hypothetical protein
MKKLLLVLIVVSLLLLGCEEPVPGQGHSPPKYVPPVKENITVEDPDFQYERDTFYIDILVDLDSFNPSEKEIKEVMEVAKFKFKQLTGYNLELREISYSTEVGGKEDYPNGYKNYPQYKHFLDDHEGLNGVIVLTKELNTEVAGGFSTSYQYLSYCNKFATPTTSDRVNNDRIHFAYIDWEHKYGACGYENGEHVSDVSINGECRNQPGTACLFNGDYYICENSQENFYSNQNNFIGSLFVHELMHPFGNGPNYDHYSPNNCPEVNESNLEDSQYYCGLCPNVYDHFKNSLVDC